MHIKTIEQYVPKTAQEVIDKDTMLTFAQQNKDALFRTNKIAHFTNSAFIVNKTKDKVLFINHLIYKSWGWIGGHNDGETNFLRAVLKEAKEETGLKNVIPLVDEPVSLDIIYVAHHFKNGLHVSDHLHLNLAYLLVADENEILHVNEVETSGVKWFPLEEALKISSEARMRPIYKKIINALKSL